MLISSGDEGTQQKGEDKENILQLCQEDENTNKSKTLIHGTTDV